MKDLSVIVVSYNTKELTQEAILSFIENIQKTPEVSYEIIVVDNNSSDGSIDVLHDISKKHDHVSIIKNKENVGFGAANNIAIKKAKGKFVLLLNTDTVTHHIDFPELMQYMDDNKDVGVMTVRVELGNGTIDPASHRGFPTIWRSFCYYSGLEKLFASIPVFSQIFGGYHLTHHNLRTVHEIDAPAGAFFFTTKNILDEVKGFDEDFFMYGEDVDLSFRIKKKGYKIIYYPLYTVIHLKHQSGLKKSKSETQQNTTKTHFYDAMRIFYKKHYAKHRPAFVNQLVYAAITLKSKL